MFVTSIITLNSLDTFLKTDSHHYKKKDVPSAESPRFVRGLGKGVSGKPYPRLCNARRLRLEPGTFLSQAVRLYRLHQARPSDSHHYRLNKNTHVPGMHINKMKHYYHPRVK